MSVVVAYVGDRAEYDPSPGLREREGPSGFAGRVRVGVHEVDQARVLRRSSTEAERVLWRLLRSRRLGGAKFRRQHPVGRFIADFACVERFLIVEVDGGQHAGSVDDALRTAWLAARGWRVIRFWNNQVLENPAGVLEEILRVLAEREPSPSQR